MSVKKYLFLLSCEAWPSNATKTVKVVLVKSNLDSESVSDPNSDLDPDIEVDLDLEWLEIGNWLL